MTRRQFRRLCWRAIERLVIRPYSAAGVADEDLTIESLVHETAHWVVLPTRKKVELAAELYETRDLVNIIGTVCNVDEVDRQTAVDWEMDALAAETLVLREFGSLEDERFFVRCCLEAQSLQGKLRAVRIRTSKRRARENGLAIVRQLEAWAKWPERKEPG